MNRIEPLQLETAFSAHDRRRFALVQPADWQNPVPKDKYDLVVIGAGAAGLITAAGAAGVGAKVALVERGAMGGDCLNVGCVPSKGLIRAARAMAAVKQATDFGVHVEGLRFDLEVAFERMRKIRADISQVDAAARYRDELGVDVFLGQATFAAGQRVVVGDLELRYKKAVVATGARAAAPPVPGLAEAGFHTNETIFDLRRLPQRLFVLGGGPIGCELAQTFARFGSQVTLADMAPRLLNNDEPEAAAAVQAALGRDGVAMKLGVQILRVEAHADGKQVFIEGDGKTETVECDDILVAAGRKPNVEQLGLDEAGVVFGPRGVQVDARLRTSNPNIYACGDIALPLQFTHIADASARIVIQNALFFGRKKWTDLVVPWATYTDPEVAHVGKTRRQLEEADIAYDEYNVPLHDVDRALLDGESDGFVLVLTAKGQDKILGATIVASHAGDMINEVTLAMQTGKGLGSLATVIHPYPTQAEAIRKAGDAYKRTRLTPRVAKLLRFLIRIRQ